VSLELENGSLLVMQGSLQHHWRHCIPKDVAGTDSRINLTFRRIVDT
jgi:alkylated DNA repair dioxygenase AlkB